MDNKQNSDNADDFANVIQFPGKKKETEEGTDNSASTPPPVPSKKARRKTKKTIVGGVLAIATLTFAVNRYTFDQKPQPLEVTGLSATSRSIASEMPHSFQRDARWEKQLAERLAAKHARGLASTNIGHDATTEERLRSGTLEEKYTILFKRDVHHLESILLQDPTTEPLYIRDRSKFLKEYGNLLDASFGSAKLDSVETGSEKTIEEYILFDKDQRPKGAALFELDRYKRLLSLKVSPATI